MVPVLHVGKMAVGLIWGITMQYATNIRHRTPEYMLLWLSDCAWNQLDGRVIGLDLIIGDFGEM